MIYYCIYKNHISDFIITGDENGINYLKFFSDEKLKEVIEKSYMQSKGFFKDIINQLDEFFVGGRKHFEVVLNPKGTDFQKKVWKALCDIPYGQTCSYKDIAVAVGNEKASRAVGMANNKNPISIIVPCHRVIGASGKLIGYAGGLDKKRILLDLEKKGQQ